MITRLTPHHLIALTTALVTLAIDFTSAYALPIKQLLSRRSSSIQFGVNSPSPTLQMNGAFNDFQGSLLLDPDHLERSSVQLTLDLQSAELRPDQILQMVFLQTALSQIQPSTTSFKSTSITRQQGDTYLVTGLYIWMGRSKSASVPIKLVKSNLQTTEIRLALNGTLKDKDAPKELKEVAPDAKGSSGWAKGTLVFLREKS